MYLVSGGMKIFIEKEFNQLERDFACNLSLGLPVYLLSFAILVRGKRL